jgi:hypothetical protein
VIYVVGEKQGSGATRRRLAALLGVPVETMMDAVVWINLWEYPGTRAERYVRLIEEGAEPRDAVILLGRRVTKAFGLGSLRALGTVSRNAGRGPIIIALPHPSGLNRWWNDPDRLDDAGIALRALWGTHR